MQITSDKTVLFTSSTPKNIREPGSSFFFSRERVHIPPKREKGNYQLNSAFFLGGYVTFLEGNRFSNSNSIFLIRSPYHSGKTHQQALEARNARWSSTPQPFPPVGAGGNPGTLYQMYQQNWGPYNKYNGKRHQMVLGKSLISWFNVMYLHCISLYHYHEAYAMENKHMLRQWDHMDTAWIHHT